MTADIAVSRRRQTPAIGVWEASWSSAPHRGLAGYLIDLGRVEEAVAVLRQDTSRPPQPSTTAWSAEPPF